MTPTSNPVLKLDPMEMKVYETKTFTAQLSGIDSHYTLQWSIEGAKAQEFAKIGGITTIEPGSTTLKLDIASKNLPSSGTITYIFRITEESGKIADISVPLKVVDSSLPSGVAIGESHSCAVLGGKLSCWGKNNLGQLGANMGTSSNAPVGVGVLNPSTVMDVAAGGNTSCALATGVLYCWGAGAYGQRGDGTTTASQVNPTRIIFNQEVSDMSVGVNHACLISAGRIYCWGLNSSGQLGDGTTTNKSTPTLVSAIQGQATAVSAGATHTCAIVAGKVTCWGGNGSGQLGDGTTTQKNAPTATTPATSDIAISVAAGTTHTCAVFAGKVKCWGSNAKGQLGDGSTASRSTVPADPVKVMPQTASIVVTGAVFSCAVTLGDVYCWGDNTTYQLGGNFVTGATQPTFVEGLIRRVVRLSTGPSSAHVCISVYTGTDLALSCWGNGVDGQIGNGQNANTPFATSPFSL